MLIPTSTSDLCPSKILQRRAESSEVSTLDSFRNWDTCMDNKTCKIVAIVGIILAVIMVFWLLSGIIRCCCCGVKGLFGALCCCIMCCNQARERDRIEEKPLRQSAYDNPHMYPKQVVYDNGYQWENNGGYRHYNQQATQMNYSQGTVDGGRHY
ncbi:unnamed protein product [Cyberlindnera jadinii]|uniref:Uncharacterized protein n=1 Tax=Cyberlindnera jadinii (strain ATCC 18201 / CBS 1600 / BCRC 20928 / JCM 3617 / NBRC 0987 / NRRL Y-1542) TaxID=983966 RepID=A0A0H5CAC3_CYBJN|nr:hypothetical protein CYBJADRAFT_168025 [Cyberlindnera jadinii NRRL Y-1542]ODV72944.1 hypothetical protein CYBJADRAFT_168025 [Cyberlindnera jadinii NRRL Y-1542]CEP20394.1 unnamed protein product [Cyberlindnera jadinii]